MLNLKSLTIAWVALWSLFMVGCSTGTPSANNAVDQEAVQVSGYAPYSASAVNLAVSQGKKTAVFFHGATCGSCAKLDANIKANVANIPSDVVVFNADWDDNQDLAVKYGAPKYHTVTYLNNDGSVAKNVWGLFELDKLVGEFAAPQAAAPAAKVATNYVPYSESAVKLAASQGKKTAVFFHGATCGSCAKLDANIKENVANIPSDVVVFNADWDDNQDLAADYEVAKYHTVSYLNDDGSVAKNVTGLFELDKLVGEFSS